jgi:D-sedoheptulose 7-phosphate isomerase
MKDVVYSELQAHKETIERVMATLQSDIEQACHMAVKAIQDGKKIILFGNGGSASDAQHIAGELTGRYKKERRGLPAISINTDTSALTAIGNDYAYDRIFERQVEALAQPGDLLVGISTTGNSENVVKALIRGKQLGCATLGLSGKGGGKMNGKCDLNIVVPSNDTPRIQEMHILIGHTICQVIDNSFD